MPNGVSTLKAISVVYLLIAFKVLKPFIPLLFKKYFKSTYTIDNFVKKKFGNQLFWKMKKKNNQKKNL